MSSMAHTPAEALGQDATVTAPVTLRIAITDGGITDPPFTPWKVVPTRCNTCGKVARRHAVSSTIEGPVAPDSKPAAAKAPKRPASTPSTPSAADKKQAREQRASERLSKLATNKAG